MEILLTDLCSASPYFRLLNKIRARQASIHWQARIQKSHPKSMGCALKCLQKMEDKLSFVDMYSITRRKYKKILKQFNSLDTRENHMRAIFGKCLMPSRNREICQTETNMLANMAMANRKQRVSDLQTRILLEIIEKEARGWLIVFNTLTVANEHYKDVFDRKSRVFEKYILSINYAVKKQATLNGKSNKRDTSKYHTYFAVVEKGGKTGRLHFHVLHCLRYLPAGSSDPNSGRKLPKCRIIAALRKYWTKGFSTPIAVRLASQDNYARIGWRWPLKMNKSGSAWEPIETSTPQRMAGYMAKYITKADEERAFRWRTRLSRGFGTTILINAIKNLPLSILENHLVSVTMWKHLEVMDIAIPMSLTRKLAVKEYLARKSKQHVTKKNGCSLSTTQKSLMTLQAQPSIVDRYRTLTQPRQRSSSQNTTCLKMQSLKRQDIFEIREVFSRELKKCGYDKIIAEGRGVTWQSQ